MSARWDRLRWRVLHGASQTVREQSGEPCRILECTAFGEKSGAVEQFGGFDQSAHLGIVTARFLRLSQAGDEWMIRIEFENPFPDWNRLPGSAIHTRERRSYAECVGY